MHSSKFFIVILLIFTILTISDFTQAQFCNDQPKINGEYQQDNFHKLPERMSEYFKAYKSGEIKQIIDFIRIDNSESELNSLQSWFTAQRKKGLISDIENICIDSINFYKNVSFAEAQGKVKYALKSRKKKTEIKLKIMKDENAQIWFSRIMFEGFDYYKFVVEKTNDSNIKYY